MSNITLTIAPRPGKKPVKNVPDSISIGSSTTVEDAKKQIAKAARISDFNRIAILEPTSQSIIKNRRAILKDVVSTTIMVKDLGPQISWKSVFIIEYIGPILIHTAIFAARPYIYSNAGSASHAQLISFAMVVLHFVKREYETLCVHKFSNSTMPFVNVYKNSAHYWLLAGINIAYWVYSPNAAAARPLEEGSVSLLVYTGVVFYLFGELANLNAHQALANLRSPGGTERGIPKGFGFGLVTCPNYMFETIAWIGILLVSRSWGTFLFVLIAVYPMQKWAEEKERALRNEFGDKYVKKNFPMLPFVPFVFSSPKKGIKKAQ